ncbi:hypothetical protein C8Q78DRAFT_29511 [Trametes maxima]|nr:hypothetical protein C8Q78DRAFT_29511 [Trametes maxima]
MPGPRAFDHANNSQPRQKTKIRDTSATPTCTALTLYLSWILGSIGPAVASFQPFTKGIHRAQGSGRGSRTTTAAPSGSIWGPSSDVALFACPAGVCESIEPPSRFMTTALLIAMDSPWMPDASIEDSSTASLCWSWLVSVRRRLAWR